MEINFKEQGLPKGIERKISLSICEDALSIFTTETTKNGFESDIVYFMDKDQLSEYLGVLLHIQAKLKRGI